MWGYVKKIFDAKQHRTQAKKNGNNSTYFHLAINNTCIALILIIKINNTSILEVYNHYYDNSGRHSYMNHILNISNLKFHPKPKNK